MRTCVWVVRSMGLCLLFLVLANVAHSQDLSLKFKNVKFPGASGTDAYGINNSGLIVGQYYINGVATHGFVLDHGEGTDIDDPNGSDTLCRNINSLGDIVGAYTKPDGNNSGFLFKDDVFTNIAPAALSAASGINDKGEIVGSEADCDFCQQHAFLWKNNQFHQLDVPGAQYTGATGINNDGVIAIIAPDNNNHFHSYLYRKGKYTELKVPGAFETFIAGINNNGDLVLSWDDKQQNTHGAIRHKGKFYTFDFKKNVQTFGFGINDNNAIVGSYFGTGGSGSFKAKY